jgi:hypothetical protein
LAWLTRTIFPAITSKVGKSLFTIFINSTCCKLSPFWASSMMILHPAECKALMRSICSSLLPFAFTAAPTKSFPVYINTCIYIYMYIYIYIWLYLRVNIYICISISYISLSIYVCISISYQYMHT